jgi:hypothetical protein
MRPPRSTLRLHPGRGIMQSWQNAQAMLTCVLLDQFSRRTQLCLLGVAELIIVNPFQGLATAVRGGIYMNSDNDMNCSHLARSPRAEGSAPTQGQRRASSALVPSKRCTLHMFTALRLRRARAQCKHRASFASGPVVQQLRGKGALCLWRTWRRNPSQPGGNPEYNLVTCGLLPVLPVVSSLCSSTSVP